MTFWTFFSGAFGCLMGLFAFCNIIVLLSEGPVAVIKAYKESIDAWKRDFKCFMKGGD